MRKTLLVTTAVAALAISPASWAQQERAPGGAGGEPGMNSKEAPAIKAPGEKTGSPSRDEKAMSGENEKASKPAMRADEQKMDSRGKGAKAEDSGMKEQPGAASRSESDNTNMQQKRGARESQGREERGMQQGQGRDERGIEQSQGRDERGVQGEQRGQRATSTEGGERGGGQISSEQRSKLRTGFKGVQVREASGVGITNVRVGASIPRTVSEYWEPVPASILEIVPAWGAYRVVRIHDEIVIIDPATFDIVYVF